MNESSGSVPRGPYVVLYSLHGLLALIFRLLKIIAFPKPPASRAPGGIHSCADKPTWALSCALVLQRREPTSCGAA